MVDGIHVETFGSGPAVLIAGGGPGVGHAHFHPWFDRLADRRTVVFLDWPGTGRSDPGDQTPAGYAAAIDRVRAHIGAETLAIVALSFGGIPALAYALECPDRVSHLVLSNAQFSASAWQEGNIDNVMAALRARHPERWERAMALRAAGVRSSADEFQELLGDVVDELEWADPAGHPALRSDPEERFSMDVYVAWLGDDPEVVVGGSLAGFEPDLAAIEARTLVITGRHDGMLTPALASRLHAGLPAGAELVVLERSAHRPWAEEPDAYFAAVEAFLGYRRRWMRPAASAW
jgi:proline iminopeptidase